MASIREYFEVDFCNNFLLKGVIDLIYVGRSTYNIDIYYVYEPMSRSRYFVLFFPFGIVDEKAIFDTVDIAYAGFFKAKQLKIVRFGESLPIGFQLGIKDNGDKGPTISAHIPGDREGFFFRNFTFTNLVYLYTENRWNDALIQGLRTRGMARGWEMVVRDTRYAAERSKLETPKAFISHDSRDKDEIVRHIAEKLRSMMCPVWYDEFSLHVGDSLKDSIEKGIKECKKCILVLTPNFLSKGGWAKREYEMIFTRELVDDKKLVLPIWSGVDVKQIFEYSPILADRNALILNRGADGSISTDRINEICKSLLNVLD
jgi:hypothetical protein